MADKSMHSESDYRAIFNAANEMIFVHDAQTGQILDANDKSCAQFGYTKEELMKLTVGGVSTNVPPYTTTEAVEWVKKAAQGIPQIFDWRCQDKSGRQFWAEVNLKQVILGGQNRILAIVRNIDERKKTEALSKFKEELLEPATLEQRLKKITETVVNIFGADFARIWLVKKGDLCAKGCFHRRTGSGRQVCQNHEQCLHLIASSGRYTHTDGEAHQRVPFGAYKIGQVASGETGSFVTNDVGNDARVYDRNWAKELGLVSFAGFRLISRQKEAIGVMALFSKYKISHEAQVLLEELAALVSVLIQSTAIEQAWLEEKGFSESVINSVPGIFYVFDETGGFIRWNENFERVSEYSREEISRMQPADFFQEDKADIARAVQEVFTKGEVAVEAAFTSKTGKKGRYFFTGKKISVHGKNYIVGMGVDITERRNIEQRLRESESRYRSIVENITDAMYSCDFKGKILEVNSVACQMLGYAREELVGAQLAKIDAQESAAQIQVRLDQLRERGQMIFESAQRDKNGQVIAVNISARVVSDAAGGRIQAFARDIRGQQTTQDELQRKIKDLELFYNVAVGREMKMIEMKKEITQLKKRLAEFMPQPKG